MAADTLERARQINPRDAGVMLALGKIYSAEREYELARDAYREALNLDPDLEAAAAGLGTCCERLGEYSEAAAIFEGFIKRGIRSFELLFALNQLPPSVVSIDVLKELDKIVRGPADDEDKFRASAAFIRATCLDRAGQCEQAWQHLVSANLAFFIDKDANLAAAMQKASLARLIQNSAKPLSGGNRHGQPISLFILGTSRSGKTSLEKLIGTLEGVRSGYENPSVENAVRRTFQSAGFVNTTDLARLPPELHQQCCEIYIDELGRRARGSKVFTNTHPANMYLAGDMARILPNVRFICVKRDPDDTALRIFMRKYKRGNGYAYNLRVIRDYVRWYHQMIDLLAKWLPDRVCIVGYEDMVADRALTLKIAANLCGLPMHQGPLPDIGDDRGCAEPYRKLMTAELES
jgi:tetratricopeptide (TPR) repeat protein